MSRNNEIPKRATGRFAYEGLDRLIHERSRLGILASLVAHPDGLLFTELKTLCSLTDGNLSRQIQLLQENGLVEIWKGYHRNRPQTRCRLSDAGRARFLEYIQTLQSVVTDASAGGKKSAHFSKTGVIGIPAVS
jgi:DNA-binding MarR family transcriptional regulator